MRRILLIFVCSLQLSVIGWSSSSTTAPLHHITMAPYHHGTMAPRHQSAVGSFDTLWYQVDSLANAGLPNSALAIVDQIYQKAEEQGNDPQLVKTILYRIGLKATFEENSLLGAINAVKREIEITREPATQILHSILGELYSSYYQWNQYRFNSRSIVADGSSDDPETWDTRQIYSEIIRNYRQSLCNETDLQEIPLEDYRAILEYPLLNSGKKDTIPSLHRTLFDFLAQRALNFFTTNNSPVIQSSTTFTLNNPAFFAQPAKFSNYPLKPMGIRALPGDGTFIPPGNDTLSLSWYAIRIYQTLAQFHLNNKNPEALIDWELKRFSYVLTKSTLIQKDSLYLEALREFEKSYNFSPASAEISFALAQALVKEGRNYNPLISGIHQWDLKDALTVCMEAAGRFPESMGGKNCRSLIKQIMAPSLQITSEYAVIPNRPSLASLSYQTIPSLYFRLVKADPEAYQKTLSGLKQKDIFNYLISMEVVSRWQVTLPSIGDYQEHRTEFSIPPAAPGFYLLVASADSLFRNSAEPFTYQALWSSGISYITQRNDQGGVDVYLLDRESGFPLKNCFIEAFAKSYESRNRQYITTKTGEYRSNESGFFTLPAPLGDASRSNISLTIRNGNDLLITQPLYVYPISDRTDRTVEQTRFYTDRSIYRPGQQVYFKGIVLERTGDSTALKPGKKTLVTFTDVNNQKVDDQWYTTDEYGSFNGIFTAPTGVLLGQMRIFNESGSTVISVEEYKRPTFEVIFNPLEGNYKLGEKVSVSGKATGYAGNAIDAGSVSYRVVRTATYPFFGGWWRMTYPPSPEVEITNGTTLTGDNGSFTIEFEALPDLSIPASLQPVFTFQLFADVTDINGETRSAQEAISVGYTSLLINITIPEKVNLSGEGNFMLSTTNLNGKSTPAEVQVTLQKLSGPNRAFKSRQWEQSDTMMISRKEFYDEFPHDIYGNDNNPATWGVEETLFNYGINTSNDSVLMLTYKGYEIGDKEGKNRGSRIVHPGSRIPDPGSYKLTLSATDPFGQKVEKIVYFTAFDPEAKRPPVAELNWFVPLQTSGEPGETASFLIGTSEKEVRVIREIRVKDQLFSREWLTLKNQQKVVEIPIQEEFRGNFSVNFLFVRENRVFQNNQVVTVPYKDKKLDIVIESFRNKLVPEQHEEWKIRITDATGKGMSASLLATMYDRSLDLFRDHSWSFNLFKRYYSANPWEVNDDFKTVGGSWYATWGNASEIFYHRYNQLNWFGWYQMGLGSYDSPLISKDGSATRSGLKDSYSMEAETFGTPVQGIPPAMDNLSTMEKQESVPPQSPENKDVPLIPVRKDFRETAFFYPSLVSDSSGNLLLKFTVPEALTSWKMMGLAYTKNLDYGLVEKELITQKDVMVFPNTPRFVRQGDTVVFIARVVNLSDHDISGEATLNLAEAITMQPLNSMILDPGSWMPEDTSLNKKQPLKISNLKSQITNPKSFSIPAGQSTSVSWTLAIPVSKFISLLEYTVTAKAGNFSDGEMNTLPVLTNRMLVTESLPLPVKGDGTFNFTFDKLVRSTSSKSLKNYRLTLEFASNPAWYAIQALPALDEKIYRNTDQVFGALYANSLASHIANSTPRIRQVFESWKRLTPDALLSNLEKNDALKSAILQETPWVLDAKSETESKRKLGLYFDMNNLQQNFRENLRLLQQMQYPSGGWPWFEGMRENRLITLSIVTGFGRLNHLGVRYGEQVRDIETMIRKAISYLDKEMVKEYEKLKKNFPDKLDQNHLSPYQVKYLYARSLIHSSPNGIPDPGSRIPDQSIETDKVLEYLTSQAKKYWLRQDLYSQGMIALALQRMGDNVTPGRIMKSLSERALHSTEMGMYWAGRGGYEWYQAPLERQVVMIEAYKEVSGDNKSVEELKIWLLKQKQTQQWSTKQGTVDACYALLLNGFDLLAEKQNVQIKLGNTLIDPDRMQDMKQEAGTGYFSLSWMGDKINPNMGNIQVTKTGEGIAWGGLYWQYFENLDQITAHETPLRVEKEIFVVKNSDDGPVLEPISNFKFQISNDTSLHHGTTAPRHHLEIGDKLKVRLIVTVDRSMEFVHLKDMRAAGLEPLPPAHDSPYHHITTTPSLSGYRYQDGLGFYQSTTDLATNFFFDYLPKGTWVFEYPLVVNNAGDFSTGIATIQCMYAPEFSAHSEGGRLEVGK